MTRDEKEFVSALRTLLRERVGDSRYELWFAKPTKLTCFGQALCVSAPNQFLLSWLQRSFEQDLVSCLTELGRGNNSSPRRLSFQLDSELPHDVEPATPSTQHKLTRRKEGPQLPKSSESLVPSLSASILSVSKISADETGVATSTAELAPHSRGIPHHKEMKPKGQRRVQQSTGDVKPGRTPRSFASLEGFVVGESNRTAFAAAELVLQQLGAFSPFFLHGPSSVGKTHLLEGIWSQTRKSGRSAVFLTAEQFTSYFVAALRGGGMPSFRRKYRDVDVLLIDDLQFICGKKRTEEELLYTIDSLGREGRQVVLASDKPPAELAGLGPELQARLQAGLACQVALPDLPEREELVRRFAQQRSMELPENVVQLVASRIVSHARELSGAVNQLFAATLSTGGEIDLGVAQNILGETRRAGPQLQLKEIEKAVCQEFQLEPKQLRSSKKTQNVSQPRMLAMWLARKHTRAALSEIGNYFGGRSHSTVVSAQKKVNGWVKSQQMLHCNTGDWTADEAVRRLESRLRVG
ncbi:MAG: DnaA/Hda family protein [Pirellulales bacterium]|nr:DnaA/Hda family protein [Pirellulales bacterium]